MLKIIGSAETRTNILHPARGMIRYAMRISNDEPNDHTTCTGKILKSLMLDRN